MLTQVKKICCLGTGTMGPGLAFTFALAGHSVQMYGRSPTKIELAFKRIRDILASFVANDLLSPEDVPQIISRINGVTNLREAMADADFVLESIVEDLAVKQKLFTEIEDYCPPETILASNTSGLSPTAIAEDLKQKERFVVTHFWNPPHLLPLVEVVPGEQTSAGTVDFAFQLLKQAGKKPVVLNREILGFIGNRLQFAMLREALALVENGIASKEAVDATVKYALGRRLATTGPLESADLGGLDVIHSISDYLMKDLCNSPEVPTLLQETVASGKLGAKSGSGFYEWNTEALQKITQERESNLLDWLKKEKFR
ncbi:MAG: 3-hydroxyacyl-CoA dehydrogenase family protein [Peptococcaceae bacterium]|jgi:3-hydroxybutyryl-CoA dehydrogenase|nr:3-hydroxyacyl-CoA dehydrogenase family protein [Peptococcaceae bacterium]